MRVVYGNLYIGNKRRNAARRRMFKGKPDIAITVESGWLIPLSARLKGYRLASARSGPAKGRTDVAVWVKRSHEYLGEIVLKVSPAMPAFGPAAHERYVVAALAHVNGIGKVAAIAWHPTPGPLVLDRLPDRDHPITEAYVEGFREVLSLSRYLRRRGFRVVFGADVQIRSDSGAPWAPIDSLRASGLPITVAEGIDILAADEQLEVVRGGIEALPEATGADHPWLSATYKRRRK